MQTLEVTNRRRLLLTTEALAPVGLWALRSGYDTPHRFQLELEPGEVITHARFVVVSPEHPLSRTWGSCVHEGGKAQISAQGSLLFVRWGQREDLSAFEGQVLPFWIDYETSTGERLLYAEGEIEVEAPVS
jgi:hypothetical protein